MTAMTSCQKCGGAMRLVGIEPHHKIHHAEIWTLECTACGHLRTSESASNAVSAQLQSASGANGFSV